MKESIAQEPLRHAFNLTRERVWYNRGDMFMRGMLSVLMCLAVFGLWVSPIYAEARYCKWRCIQLEREITVNDCPATSATPGLRWVFLSDRFDNSFATNEACMDASTGCLSKCLVNCPNGRTGTDRSGFIAVTPPAVAGNTFCIDGLAHADPPLDGVCASGLQDFGPPTCIEPPPGTIAPAAQAPSVTVPPPCNPVLAAHACFETSGWAAGDTRRADCRSEHSLCSSVSSPTALCCNSETARTIAAAAPASPEPAAPPTPPGGMGLPGPLNLPDCATSHNPDVAGKCTLDSIKQVGVNFANFLMGLAAAFFLLIFVYAGFKYIFFAYDSGTAGEARKMLVSSAIGMLLVLGAATIVKFVQTTATGGTAPAASAPTQPVTPPARAPVAPGTP